MREIFERLGVSFFIRLVAGIRDRLCCGRIVRRLVRSHSPPETKRRSENKQRARRIDRFVRPVSIHLAGKWRLVRCAPLLAELPDAVEQHDGDENARRYTNLRESVRDRGWFRY